MNDMLAEIKPKVSFVESTPPFTNRITDQDNIYAGEPDSCCGGISAN